MDQPLEYLPCGGDATVHLPLCWVRSDFCADPGALDNFLDHTNRRRQEEAVAGLAWHRRHTILPDTTSMKLWPNPFYRPPNRHDDVPQRLSSVRAPPEDLDCWTLEDRVLQLRWIFRRLFGKRVEDALVWGTGAAVGKRHRTSTPVADVTNPEKRAKSDTGQSQEVEGSTREPISVQSQDSSAPGETQLQMSTAVRLERVRPMGRDEEMSGVVEGQGDTPRSMTTSPVPPAGSPGSTKKTKSKMPKKTGASTQETAPREVRPSSKKKRQRSNPPSSGASDAKSAFVLHPGARLNGNGYARRPTWIPDN